uniref:Uncharacterized protein n=1 Tax=Solanum lycopersicum TaxID=4081 RepID=A0A3Q7EIW5_SOLLC
MCPRRTWEEAVRCKLSLCNSKPLASTVTTLARFSCLHPLKFGIKFEDGRIWAALRRNYTIPCVINDAS